MQRGKDEVTRCTSVCIAPWRTLAGSFLLGLADILYNGLDLRHGLENARLGELVELCLVLDDDHCAPPPCVRRGVRRAQEESPTDKRGEAGTRGESDGQEGRGGHKRRVRRTRGAVPQRREEMGHCTNQRQHKLRGPSSVICCVGSPVDSECSTMYLQASGPLVA